jgi:hypothetical protein
MFVGSVLPLIASIAASTHLAPMPTGFCVIAPASTPLVMASSCCCPES